MARFFLIILMFVLVGCTTPPDKLSTNERRQIYRDNQQRLQFLYQWQMSGRVAFHYERGGDALNVDWIQYYRDFGIKLSGPMNIGAAYLIGNKDGVTYKDGKGHEDHAPSPEALLQAYTGYRLPLSSLRYWLIGMPDPTMLNDMTLNPQGFPIQMRQGPWTVQFGYFREVGEYMLPHKLSMKHADLSITLTVHDWDLKNITPVSSQYKSKPLAQLPPVDAAAQPAPVPNQTSQDSSTLNKTSGKKPKPDPQAAEDAYNAAMTGAPSATQTNTNTSTTNTAQHDPATGNSLMGQSFPPKKAASQKPSQPAPLTSQPKEDSEPVQYTNETSGTDMTESSMHP